MPEIKVNGLAFSILPVEHILKEYWTGRYFEKTEIEFIMNILHPTDIFFDIGSNVGLFSLAAGKKSPGIQIYAFEPCESIFSVLQENIKLNHLNNVHAYKVALSNFTGEALLQVNAPGCDGLNTLGKPMHPGCRVVTQAKVPVMTLRQFLTEQNVSRVDCMKVDVEGAELLVFQGGKDLLTQEEGPLILYESGYLTTGFDYHSMETIRFLQEHGYTIYVLRKNKKIFPLKSEKETDLNANLVAVKSRSKMEKRLLALRYMKRETG